MNSKFKITHFILDYGNKRQEHVPNLAQNPNPKHVCGPTSDHEKDRNLKDP
jgi:hypothetical protein